MGRLTRWGRRVIDHFGSAARGRLVPAHRNKRGRAMLSVESLEDRTVPSSTPVANNEFTDTDAGNAVVINVLSNDASPVAIDPTTVTIVTSPTHGSTSVNGTTGE